MGVKLNVLLFKVVRAQLAPQQILLGAQPSHVNLADLTKTTTQPMAAKPKKQQQLSPQYLLSNIPFN
jgi:hypothetical protein